MKTDGIVVLELIKKGKRVFRYLESPA